jgi:magnesium chelatase subunit I
MDDLLTYPFLAIVGQPEMKTALMLALVNPQVGGVLLIGPYGVGKTTAVRALTDIMPMVDREERDEEGRTVLRRGPMRIIELPLNARLDDVVGGINERVALEQQRVLLEEGALARAHRNLLYIDEINLLGDEIIDAILDAAAQGVYTVRRSTISATYRARFVLIGSMNPEEGKLRPQILDRFGLRVVVRGLDDADQRLEAYRRVQAYLTNPRAMIGLYAEEIAAAMNEIQEARKRLPHVRLPDKLAHQAIALIQKMGVDSLRAEITLFEAARAYTAADGREEVTLEDLRAVAPMALRLRRSVFMNEYFDSQKGEEDELKGLLNTLTKGARGKKASARVKQKTK